MTFTYEVFTEMCVYMTHGVSELSYIVLLCCCRYYEVTILTSGSIRVGWAKPTMHPETGLGEDEESFAFDGSLVCEGSL